MLLLIAVSGGSITKKGNLFAEMPHDHDNSERLDGCYQSKGDLHMILLIRERWQ